ncbi:MAG: hypothetical protein M3Q78_11100 [Acidobacteriota bacterium]|nr:hypothetical protein [Acidobacteriota bacterium]
MSLAVSFKARKMSDRRIAVASATIENHRHSNVADATRIFCRLSPCLKRHG